MYNDLLSYGDFIQLNNSCNSKELLDEIKDFSWFKYNDSVIGKILIGNPYPFALIKLFDPEFSVFKDKKLKINNNIVEIIS